jgi:hypothetical protein
MASTLKEQVLAIATVNAQARENDLILNNMASCY